MMALMYLLILDFSGSMYQKVNNVPKYVVLQENVRALNQSLNDEALQSRTSILAFGLNPKKKCDDFYSENIETRNMSQVIDRLRPGAFSMTPLAESIKRGTDIAIKDKVKKVIIFSDGADSCGKDPCKELVLSNNKLVAAKYVMNIKFIGINLKKNDPKFECFRSNKLSNINVEYSNIGDSSEANEALQSAAQGDTISLSTIRSPWGIIKVRGAPSSVKFKATSQIAKLDNKNREIWYGDYRNQLKESGYIISAKFPGTKKVQTYITADQEKELYWSDFFKEPNSTLKYSRSKLSVRLSPATTTQQAHRSTTSVAVEGLLEKETNKEMKLPFGEWMIEPLSPPWLKDLVENKKINLKPQSTLKIDLLELFEIEWVQNPDPAQRWVIEIEPPPDEKKEEAFKELSLDESAAAVSSKVATVVVEQSKPIIKEKARYFIQEGVELIPIPFGAKVKWLKSRYL